jgi:methionyl-tRNA formyltransferase
VLLRGTVPIGPADTAGDLHDRLSALGAGLIVEALTRLDDLVAVPQPEAGVTHAAKIDKAEARIDWTRPAAEIDRVIRSLAPFPGAWTMIDGERVKLLLAEPAVGAGAPGLVLDAAPTIACGSGALRLLRLQRAGKAPLEASEFQRGRAMVPGQVLGTT